MVTHLTVGSAQVKVNAYRSLVQQVSCSRSTNPILRILAVHRKAGPSGYACVLV
jgi:hypothetical protein